jgi:uncharacterized repeat protein (TIGR03803 family)
MAQKIFRGGFGVPEFAFFLIFLALNFGFVCRSGAQAWVTNSPMFTTRWSQTATVLTNGSVLIAGGTVYNDFVNNIFETTNDAELYNPAIGAPALTGFMNDDRALHDATLLTNGQVLVTGGGRDATSEIYDPGSGSWIDFVNMNDERTLHVAVRLPSGRVLAAAGINDNTAVDLSSAEIYDPGTATWTSITPMTYAADSLAYVLLTNGTVLVCGGSFNGSAVNNAVIFYPKTQTWTNTAPMLKARANHAATLLSNGKVLVEGGTFDNSAEIYDPVAGTWTLAASMNDGRDFCNAVLLTNGEVMVSGDDNPDVELYDPVHNSWSLTAPLPVPGFDQTESVMSNGWVLVTGGDTSEFNGPGLDIVETYSLSGSPTNGGTPGLVVTNSPLSGALPLAVQFTSPSLDSQGFTVTNWSWTFGDGGTSSSQNPLHTYTNAGTYTPSLVAYSTSGSTALIVSGLNTITVTNYTLSDSATPQSGMEPLTVQFTSSGTDSGGHTVTNWSWTFGDGATSTAQNPSHTYTAIGTYFPLLTAYSTVGSRPLSTTPLGAISVAINPNPAFTTLYSFASTSGSSFTNTYGATPNGGLILIGQTLYGTTGHGGPGGGGNIFAIGANGSGFADLYNFTLNNGEEPGSGLTASGSTLYGTTSVGGSQGGGTVFAISTNGLGYTNLYYFSLGGSSIGSQPTAGVVLSNSTLFGTTVFGGQYTEGAVFEASTSASNIIDIHSFLPADGNNVNGDGLFPFQTLVLAGPTLYGTTEGGGTSASGTVFRVNTNSPYTFTTLHYFPSLQGANDTNSDGAFPFAGLVLSGTNLYGTTDFGGLYGYGTIFAVSTNGSVFTNLYNFTGGSDGGNTKSGLTVSGNMLYGTTPGGGTGNGTLFSIRTDGTGFTNLYSFGGGSGGSSPGGTLLLAGVTLYGATGSGGSGGGTLFSYVLPVPQLYITASGTNAILTWSTLAPGYTLQSTPQLSPTAVWSTVSPLQSIVNGLNTVTNRISGTQKFYRLMQ